MSDAALVLGLESRLINAWPSLDYQTYDGWLLRLARGYSKRANSASPLVPGARLDDALIDHMVEHFLAANVRPTGRVDPSDKRSTLPPPGLLATALTWSRLTA